MTLSLTVIAILVLVGLLLLLLEVLVIPGTGAAGIIGFVLIGVAIWQAFAHHGVVAGGVTTAATVVLSVGLIYGALKAKTWKKLSLDDRLDGKVNVVDPEAVKVGDTGVTIGRLAPTGKAEINGKYYEVRTYGGYLEQDTPIEVLKVDRNVIYVKSIKS
ncbi:MAG: hypothetical protein CSA95_09155 [Bacteroidetes bacterium]|nr:MAG: hypothetical protein CSA95_09155 [Bacteroidota bacterium]PIE87801.1 MAG: hypothetical protein CSA04_05115 [Bacteroidota bacterium]